MPVEGIAAGLSGLLGGYVQGQRLKQEFEKERQDLAFKKKELEVREGLLHRQVQKDLLEQQMQAEEVISAPGIGVIRKRGGAIVHPTPRTTLRDLLTGFGGAEPPAGTSLGPDTPSAPAGQPTSPLTKLPAGVSLSLPVEGGGTANIKNPTVTEGQQLGEWAIALQRSGWKPGEPITQDLIDRAAAWRLEQAQGKGVGERSVLMRSVIQKHGGLTDEALREYETRLEGIRRAEASGTVAGGFTGPAREAKAETAEAVGEAG